MSHSRSALVDDGYDLSKLVGKSGARELALREESERKKAIQRREREEARERERALREVSKDPATLVVGVEASLGDVGRIIRDLRAASGGSTVDFESDWTPSAVAPESPKKAVSKDPRAKLEQLVARAKEVDGALKDDASDSEYHMASRAWAEAYDEAKRLKDAKTALRIAFAQGKVLQRAFQIRPAISCADCALFLSSKLGEKEAQLHAIKDLTELHAKIGNAALSRRYWDLGRALSVSSTSTSTPTPTPTPKTISVPPPSSSASSSASTSKSGDTGVDDAKEDGGGGEEKGREEEGGGEGEEEEGGSEEIGLRDWQEFVAGDVGRGGSSTPFSSAFVSACVGRLDEGQILISRAAMGGGEARDIASRFLTTKFGASGVTFLHCASVYCAESSFPMLLRSVLTIVPKALEAQDAQGRIPLWWAAALRRSITATALLQASSPLPPPKVLGLLPVDVREAISELHEEVAENGPDPDLELDLGLDEE